MKDIIKNNSISILIGENIQYLAIRVLNKKREVLTSPPGTNRKYRVKLSIPTMGKDFGTTLITYSRSITEEGRVEFQSSDKVKDAHQVCFLLFLLFYFFNFID